jgi:hypothetical protein
VGGGAVSRPPVSYDDRLARYLLGKTTDAERQAIEDEYFSDNEAFQALAAVEDALVEEYVRGELSPDDRFRFETHVLGSREGREKLRLARSLIEVARNRDAVPAGRFAYWSHVRITALAATFLIALAAAWKMGVFRTALDTVHVPPSSRPAPSPAPSTVVSPAESIIASLEIVPGMTRAGGSIPKLELKPTTHRLRIRAYLDIHGPPGERFSAILETLDRRHVVRREGLSAISTDAGLALDVELPAAGVPPGDYLLSVFRIHPGAVDESVVDYRLRIVKAPSR